MQTGNVGSWTVEQDGLTYRVDLFTDDDANADPAGQGDCYDAADIEAHERGDWLFTGVVVTPVIGGRPVDEARDSLWSVEFGSNEGWRSERNPRGVIDQDEISRYPVPDMICEVRANLAKLRDGLVAEATRQANELAALSLDDCPERNPAVAPNLSPGACMRALGHDLPHRDSNGQEWS